MFIILVYASVTFKTKCDIRSVHEHLKETNKKTQLYLAAFESLYHLPWLLIDFLLAPTSKQARCWCKCIWLHVLSRLRAGKSEPSSTKAQCGIFFFFTIANHINSHRKQELCNSNRSKLFRFFFCICKWKVLITDVSHLKNLTPSIKTLCYDHKSHSGLLLKE